MYRSKFRLNTSTVRSEEYFELLQIWPTEDVARTYAFFSSAFARWFKILSPVALTPQHLNEASHPRTGTRPGGELKARIESSTLPIR